MDEQLTNAKNLKRQQKQQKQKQQVQKQQKKTQSSKPATGGANKCVPNSHTKAQVVGRIRRQCRRELVVLHGGQRGGSLQYFDDLFLLEGWELQKQGATQDGEVALSAEEETALARGRTWRWWRVRTGRGGHSKSSGDSGGKLAQGVTAAPVATGLSNGQMSERQQIAFLLQQQQTLSAVPQSHPSQLQQQAQDGHEGDDDDDDDDQRPSGRSGHSMTPIGGSTDGTSPAVYVFGGLGYRRDGTYLNDTYVLRIMGSTLPPVKVELRQTAASAGGKTAASRGKGKAGKSMGKGAGALG